MDLEQVWYLIHPHYGSNCPSGADIASRIALGFGGARVHTHMPAVRHVWQQREQRLFVSQSSSISRSLHLNLHSHLFVLEIFFFNEKYSYIKRGSPSRGCSSQHKRMARTRPHSIPPGLCHYYIPQRKLRSWRDPGIWWVVKAMHAVDRQSNSPCDSGGCCTDASLPRFHTLPFTCIVLL